jgi:hypothetical protein
MAGLPPVPFTTAVYVPGAEELKVHVDVSDVMVEDKVTGVQ